MHPGLHPSPGGRTDVRAPGARAVRGERQLFTPSAGRQADVRRPRRGWWSAERRSFTPCSGPDRHSAREAEQLRTGRAAPAPAAARPRHPLPPSVMPFQAPPSAAPSRPTRALHLAPLACASRRAPACHASITRWSAGSPSRTVESSLSSARNRCDGPLCGWPMASKISVIRSGSVISSARPLTFASPCQSDASPVPAVQREARVALEVARLERVRHADPNHSSPSMKLHSVPLMRGEPSLAQRGKRLVLAARRENSRARAASSGACASTSLQRRHGPEA